MQHFPIFMDLQDRAVVIAGGGEAALAKLRLLGKTPARLSVFAAHPCPGIVDMARDGRIALIRRPVTADDLRAVALAYAAHGDAAQDAGFAALARAEGVLVNIVDDLAGSQFLTPAIVDRSPVTVAIGTEGTAPVLARILKADIEARLPAGLGLLARAGQAFRRLASTLPMGRPRRDFWADYFLHEGPAALDKGGEAALPATLDDLLARHEAQAARPGHVAFVGAGPGDPELLTLKARRALDTADVVIHDRLIAAPILDLARREAVLIAAGKEGFGPSTPQEDINALILRHARAGAQVVRLKSGDPAVFGRLDEEIEACDAAGIGWHVVPGITAASASAAAIGQSLTRRGRNSEARLLTGHDVAGFAEQDWQRLARSGTVAAIYMGRKGARFLQGRLMMHGADPATPVSLIENASRPDQRIVAATLASLSDTVQGAAFSGPVLILYGLSPRMVAEALPLPQAREALS
ncbi:MAG: siroheme synthase CysG [Qingshengfaniella sp.]